MHLENLFFEISRAMVAKDGGGRRAAGGFRAGSRRSDAPKRRMQRPREGRAARTEHIRADKDRPLARARRGHAPRRSRHNGAFTRARIPCGMHMCSTGTESMTSRLVPPHGGAGGRGKSALESRPRRLHIWRRGHRPCRADRGGGMARGWLTGHHGGRLGSNPSLLVAEYLLMPSDAKQRLPRTTVVTSINPCMYYTQ